MTRITIYIYNDTQFQNSNTQKEKEKDCKKSVCQCAILYAHNIEHSSDMEQSHSEN